MRMVRVVIEYDADDEATPLGEILQNWYDGKVGLADIIQDWSPQAPGQVEIDGQGRVWIEPS